MTKLQFACFTGKSPEEKANELGSLLLRRDFLVRVDRKFKKPPPGQERLIKFPKKVVLVVGPDAKTFAETDFYAWRFEVPTSLSTYILSALAAVGVLLVSLFPVAPPVLKAAVLYVLAGFLAIIIAILVIRGLVALVSWIVTGQTVWILPNALADDKPISQLFKPLISVQQVDAEARKGFKAWALHIAMRLTAAVSIIAVTYVLYSKGPGTEEISRNAFRYRDELFDILKVNPDTKLLNQGQVNATNVETAKSPNTSSTVDGQDQSSKEQSKAAYQYDL